MTLVHNAGFPHSEIPGSQPAHGSPRLIAVFHVLHRHLAPRHPPYALSSLTQRDAEKLTFFHFSLSAIRLLMSDLQAGSSSRRAVYPPRSSSQSPGPTTSIDKAHYALRPGTPPGRQGPIAIVLELIYSVQQNRSCSQTLPLVARLRWR